MKVVVVGAGIMGSASALALARTGCDVVLVERAIPGAEASSAAAGMLGAQLECHAPGPEFDTFVRARDGYRAWAEELVRATGVDVGYRACGALQIATNDDELATLEKIVAWQQRAGARAELLDAAQARRIEGGIGPRVRGAAYFPDEAQVEPARLMRALDVAVAREARITLQSGTTVKRVLVEPRTGRAVGVALEANTFASELRGDAVVLAAGSWSSMVPGIEHAVPEVRPARGQLVMLEERPPRLSAILAGAGAYVVPRGDGRVVCGTTLEFVGFRREVTAGGIAKVLSGAIDLVPVLQDAAITATWSSFRPYSTTEKPLVGASEIPGLVLATGHHRNGILLAHVTAEAVRNAVTSIV